MIPFLKRLCWPFQSCEEDLLRAYPCHLALIDSRKIPHSFDHGPDLTYLIESADYYYDLICRSAGDMVDWEQQWDPEIRPRAVKSHHRMVMGTWGLIARGADGMIQANALMHHDLPQVRVCGEHFFLGIRHAGRVPEVYQQVCKRLGVEGEGVDEYPHLEPTPSIMGLIGSLGWLRARQSVPLLSHYTMRLDQDEPIRLAAAISLGRVVHKRFDRQPEIAIELACKWVAQHTQTTPEPESCEPASCEPTLS